MANFFAELKRRHIYFRVGTAYAVVAATLPRAKTPTTQT
jgi:hypothetical protein